MRIRIICDSNCEGHRIPPQILGSIENQDFCGTADAYHTIDKDGRNHVFMYLDYWVDDDGAPTARAKDLTHGHRLPFIGPGTCARKEVFLHAVANIADTPPDLSGIQSFEPCKSALKS